MANQSEARPAEPKAEGKSKNTNPDLFEQLFNVWEKRTSDYFDKLLRNQAFLNTMGGLMSAGYRNKIQLNRAMTTLWKNLNLPNKGDQERTLHLLNELHSRIFDLETKIERLEQVKPVETASAASAASETKRARSRQGAGLRAADRE